MTHRLAVVLGLALSACIPFQPARRSAGAPVAARGRAITIDAATAPIQARLWMPHADSRAVVLLVPAVGDGSAAVLPLAERLVAAGATVLALERSRDVVPSSYLAMSRLTRLAGWLRQRVPRAPLLVAGHGDGGVLALRLAQDDDGPIAGVVALGPPLSSDASLPRLALWTAAHGRLSFGTGLGHLAPLWDEVATLDEPVLITPGDDPDAAAIARDFAARSSSPDRTVTAADDAAVAAWMVEHVGTARPAPALAPAGLPAPGLAVSLTLGAGVARFEGGSYTDGGIAYGRALVTHGEIGWAGGLSYQGIGGSYALMPLGLGWRLGRAGQLALVGGLGLGGELTGTIPVEASAELPLGRHLRGLATATVAWDLDDHRPDDLAASIDDVQVRVGLRVLGDRRLWQRVTTGGGVYLAGTYRRLGDADIIGFELGFHFWGSR